MKYLIMLFAGLILLTSANTSQADLTDIDNKQLQSLLDEGVPIVDVRRKDEWQATGVIAGSHLLTFFDEQGRYDANAWLGNLSEVINPEEPFILICHAGMRSLSVGKWLGKNYDTVYNVENGIAHWIKDGLEVGSASEDQLKNQ